MRTVPLSDTTRLEIGYDPALRNFFAHLWQNENPAGSLGIIESLPAADDLVDAIPALLESNNVPELTDDQRAALREAVIRAKGGPDAMILDLLTGKN